MSLLLRSTERLAILKSSYAFSTPKAEEDWDRSITLLRKLVEVRKSQNTHLEASISAQNGGITETPTHPTILSWSWHVTDEWIANGPGLSVVDSIFDISFYAGNRRGISYSPTVCVWLFKNERDWERAEQEALELLKGIG